MIQIPSRQISHAEILAELTRLEHEILELAKVKKYLDFEECYQHQKGLLYLVDEGVQKLAEQADSINHLASQLESAMLQFKEIAVKVNPLYHAIQQPPNAKTILEEIGKFHRRSLNVWEVHSVAVPVVVKHKYRFILTARNLDLFRSQTNAVQVGSNEDVEKFLVG